MGSTDRKFESPFLAQFTLEQPDAVETWGSEAEPADSESPFQSVYTFQGERAADEPEREEWVSFLAELRDREFDEALFELADEAADLVETRFEGEDGVPYPQAERLVEEHFAPQRSEVDHLFEALERELEGKDLDVIGEAELEAMIDRYTPAAPLTPAFEHFFGRLKRKLKKAFRKVKKVAKRVVKGVGKIASKLNPLNVLKKLRKLIKPLLRRVLKFALHKLPKGLQPLARKLGGAFLKEADLDTTQSLEEETTVDPGYLQAEFDEQVARVILDEDETRSDLALAHYAQEPLDGSVESNERLAEARDQFAHRLNRLQQNEDPAPAVEEFVPLLLPALKLGLRIVGRKRVVSFLAKILGRLIKRFVGEANAGPLSRAMVDAGLRLINLEHSPEVEARLAGEAVVDTVEETIRRISALPDHVLDNEHLLGAAALEAFEAAAATYLPPVLPETVYEQRPELRETVRARGIWVARASRRRPGAYRKYTRVFDRELTPHMALAVRSWRGMPLQTMLHDGSGLGAGRTLRVRVHVFEAMPGTWLSRIARRERAAIGIGARPAGALLHPLTPDSASMLLGEPGLGRAVSSRFLDDPMRIAVGQRFYLLEIVDAAGPGGYGPALALAPRCCLGHVSFDFVSDQVKYSVYLSEAQAQEIALQLRRHTPGSAPAFQIVQHVVHDGLRAARERRSIHQVDVIHPRLDPRNAVDVFFQILPAVAVESQFQQLADRASEAIGFELARHPQRFIAATEDPSAGLTLTVNVRRPAGMSALRRFLNGEPVAWTELRARADESPETDVRVEAGYRRG